MLAGGLQNCALVGFNLRGFDIPVLNREFSLAGFEVALEFLPVIDGFSIFQQKHPRDLDAAVRVYCGRSRTDAHDASVDVFDTLDVILGQLRAHEDLPRDVMALAEFCDRKRPEFIDRTGKFQWRHGEAIVAFGKHQGVLLRHVDHGFLRWMLGRDFPADAKEIALCALNGEYPIPPQVRALETDVEKGTEKEETNHTTASSASQGGLFEAHI